MEDEPALEGVVLWCHSKFIKLFVDCKDSEWHILKRLGDDCHMAQLVDSQFKKETGLKTCLGRNYVGCSKRRIPLFRFLPTSNDDSRWAVSRALEELEVVGHEMSCIILCWRFFVSCWCL
jgi:hypothetical protein